MSGGAAVVQPEGSAMQLLAFVVADTTGLEWHLKFLIKHVTQSDTIAWQFHAHLLETEVARAKCVLIA